MNLVTGGTGLVGSHLIYKLLISGEAVKVFIRKSSNKTEIKKTISFYSDQYEELFKKIEWAEGDVLDYHSIYEACENVQQVYHTAACISFHPADKYKIFQNNIFGTANVVNACIEKKVKKLCHVSSVAALGNAEDRGMGTEETPWKPKEKHSNYSISKFHSEMEVWRGIAEGLDAIIVNPSVIIGPGNWKKGSPSFFNVINKGMRFYTNGITGFVDVKDVVDILVQLTKSETVNQRFIISSENISYKDFFIYIADSLQKPHPGIEAKPYMTSIACKFESIKHLIFRIPPLITKESLSAAYHIDYYSNKKIRDLLHYNFIPVKKSIEDTAIIFKNRKI